MTRRFLHFCDGEVIELSPFSISKEILLSEDAAFTYAEIAKLQKQWERCAKWSGTSDTAYNDFLRHNCFDDIDLYSIECVQDSTVVEYPNEEPVIDWEKVYGAD